MSAGNPHLVQKTSPEQCPFCGEKHVVEVDEADEVVDVLRVDDQRWAQEYPLWEGYRFYYKKCTNGTQQELRVVAREAATTA